MSEFPVAPTILAKIPPLEGRSQTAPTLNQQPARGQLLAKAKRSSFFDRAMHSAALFGQEF